MRHLTSHFQARTFVKSTTKFDKAVSLAKEVLSLYENHDAVNALKKFDTLVSYLLKNFDGEISTSSVRDILVNSNIDGLNPTVLSCYSQYLVPVIVVRELLYKNKVCIDPRKAKNWNKFFEKYYKTILAA